MEEKEHELRQARHSLANMLARRDHSELELQQKLSLRYSQEIVETVLTEAKEKKWLSSPEELAERVSEQLHRKLKGRRYITQYLKKKGLPLPALCPEREQEKAQELLARHFQWDLSDSTQSLPLSEKQRAFHYLQRRGYEEALIRDLLF